ncbi:MAG TPA: M23 family metallopeptidase, partial [Kribbella sp.]|uniref:M23 family metallopeptidase n=1 Tax=Kribbella sp. TaxID=1871183 RepID=UPI002D7822D6
MKITRKRSPSHLALACPALSLFALALMPVTAGAAPGEETGWPLSPRPEMVRGFEAPAKPWLPGHRGVDLAGSPGQAVLSATAGTITYAGPLAGRGVIVVTRGPIRTTYEPVIAALPLGAAVNPGDTIGHLSAAASHCAPATCLHWGLRQSDTYLNPLTLLPTQPVRLLPRTPPEPQALRPHTPPQPQALPARTAPPQPQALPAGTRRPQPEA